LLRSADAFGVSKVYMSGYTPYPRLKNDPRLPHIADKMTRQIHKSALGAETSVSWAWEPDIFALLARLTKNGVEIAALEQTETAKSLPGYGTQKDIAIIVGREVEGLEEEVLKAVDVHLQIPMLGAKESLNVASAGAIALYQLRFSLQEMDRSG